jgi:putative spermidine/putrescine transport system permease protein
MRRSQSGEPSELDLMAMACLAPSLLYVLFMFVYPFLYGVYVSLRPLKVPGFSLANYISFFTDQYQYKTVAITFRLAVPNTIVVVAISLLFAYNMRRGIWLERTITTILVLPISLGVILLGQGILGFYGGKGLGYISGIDPSIENSARTLGANPWTVFRRVMLPLIAPGLAIAFALVFVMSFATFPSAILLGQPSGATRTIAIAAYAQAFEMFDMPYASAIAVIMGIFQLAGLLVIILLRKRMVTAATMGVGKR